MTLYYATTTNANQKTLDAALNSGVTASATFNNTTGIQNKKGVFVVDRVDTNGVLTPNKREYIGFTGTSGSTVVTLTRNIDGGGSDQDHAVGAIVEFGPDAVWADGVMDALDNLVDSTGAVDTTKVVTVAGTQTVSGAKTFSEIITNEKEITGKQVATPANPASGYNKLYFKSDDKIYKLSSAGVEAELGAGGTAAETFIIPGTLATGTDLAKTWVLPFDCKLQSATPYVKTAGTTNATTFDINLAGSTIATTKLSIASGATSGSNQALDDPTTTRTAGSLITIDVDSISTTPPVESYIVLFYERV